MKEALLKLIEAERISNELDEAWGNDPENEELEKAYDEAYAQEWFARGELIVAITKATGIDRETVRIMIKNKRTDLERLIMRMA